ncbi:MAG: hypothetical protein Q9219_000504 [cf. Caloplaca sp. 3 TL-2023]
MTTQAMLIADTIAGMKKALARGRETYSSDSEESIGRYTNRGNKLKRKARYVREGQLDRPNGPKVYKRRIEHAGYYRDVISLNPQRYDVNGDRLEEDEEDEDADAAAAEANPYDGIILQELLAPLTSAADLPTHPSLSVPYLSPILSNMTQEACEMVQRERNSIRGIKLLLTKLRGDQTWIPGSSLTCNIDDVIFDTSKVYNDIVRSRPSLKSFDKKDHREGKAPLVPLDEASVKPTADERAMNREQANEAGATPFPALGNENTTTREPPEPSSLVGTSDGSGSHEEPEAGDNSYDKDIHSQNTARQDFEVQAMDAQLGTEEVNNTAKIKEIPIHRVNKSTAAERSGSRRSSLGGANDDPELMARAQPDTTAILDIQDSKVPEGSVLISTEGQDDVSMLGNEEMQAANGDVQPIPHRMRTRAQAQAVPENTTPLRTRSPSVASSFVPSIHPLFHIPSEAIPDKNFGLPPEEAEATRHMLMSYIQKHEEVCRGADKLYVGLLKAERMKKHVWDSCKAEGHVGEMSDGEDWYDKEEWGLEEDLRKGRPEEEDDATTQHKKTRGRRA